MGLSVDESELGRMLSVDDLALARICEDLAGRLESSSQAHAHFAVRRTYGIHAHAVAAEAAEVAAQKLRNAAEKLRAAVLG